MDFIGAQQILQADEGQPAVAKRRPKRARANNTRPNIPRKKRKATTLSTPHPATGRNSPSGSSSSSSSATSSSSSSSNDSDKPSPRTAKVTNGMKEADADTKMPAVAAGAPVPGLRVLLELESDKGVLTKYQTLIRKHVYLFEVTKEDLKRTAQGRNKPIELGQVGVLCKHCATTDPVLRPSGSCYFPSHLQGVYQAVQNMVSNHFLETCTLIPIKIRGKMLKLKEKKRSLWGGGRQYWVHGCQQLGVIEQDDCLVFSKQRNQEQSSKEVSSSAFKPSPRAV